MSVTTFPSPATSRNPFISWSSPSAADAAAAVDRFASPLARRLVGEWQHLRSDPTTRRRIAAWNLFGSSVVTLDQVLVSTGFLGANGDVDGDQRLLGVLRIAADDLTAARVVLQRLLPGLVATAKRYGGPSWSSRQAAFDELTAHAWIGIRRFPCDRRARHAASYLLRNAEYDAFIREHRLASSAEVISPIDRLPERAAGANGRARESVSAMEELVEIIVDGRGSGLSEADLRLVVRMAAGMPVGEMAKERGLTPRALLPHRQRAIDNLRRITLELAA